MQHDSNVETPQAEIPEFLRCDPRFFTVILNKDFDEILESKIEICIKCTDEHISYIFNDWFGDESKNIAKRILMWLLIENKNNKLAVFLKLIAWLSTNYCIQSEEYIIDLEHLNQSIKSGETLKIIEDCFEVKNIKYDVYLNPENFEIEPVMLEGANS